MDEVPIYDIRRAIWSTCSIRGTTYMSIQLDTERDTDTRKADARETKLGACPKIGMCRWCAHHMCQFKAVLEDGKIVKLLNFDESPFTPDFKTSGCPRLPSMPEDLVGHSQRTCFPLKRKGRRGEGKWEQIDWEQALDEIAERLAAYKERHGAESVALMTGCIHEPWDLARFFNLFGSPNVCNVNAPICSGLEAFMNIVCAGGMVLYGPPNSVPECVVTWGGEHWTTGGLHWKILKLAPNHIVVNSTGSPHASKATVWLQPRPGTDTALAYGWMHVIIGENLYDKEFVERWTFGFDKLKERALNEFPLERVEAITGVPREKIAQAARMYATAKPSYIGWGTATGHIGRNAAEVERARLALRAITGNIDVDGGNHFLRGHSKLVSIKELCLDELLPATQYRKALGSDRWRVLSWRGWEMLSDKKSQRAFVSRGAIYPALVHAIRTGEPYRVRSLFINGCNPMVTIANTRNFYQALKSDIELSVCMDPFVTPTSMLCDYVLPVTWFPERSTINYLGQANSVVVGQRILPKAKPGEFDRRDDYEVWAGLGRRLGQAEHWPWQDLDDAHDYRLHRFGMSLDEFAETKGWDTEELQFKSYEKGGFRTPTGKLELWSTTFDALGYDPLPHYEEPAESPVSRPELAREFPFVLQTKPKSRWFIHSQMRQSDRQRKRHRYPFCLIHPTAAKKLGIQEGDMVWLESPRGRIQQQAKLTEDVLPNVIAGDFGWWFPEKPAEEPSLFGVFESNLNVLSSDAFDYACECSGSWNLDALLCKVYKVEEIELRLQANIKP